MFRVLFTTVLLLAAGTSQAQSLVNRHLSTPMSRNVLYMSQDVTLAGDMGSSAKVAPLTTSSAGFGIDKNAVKLSGMPVSGMPRINLSNPTSQVTALTTAKSWMNANMPMFQSQVGTYIKSKGLSSAFYSFTQEIMVNTPVGPKKRAVAFNVSVDQNGRPIHGSPKIVDPEPTVLEAMYVPKAAIDGLPATWAYPDAGFIKYRLLNKKYEPITSYMTIDTGGAFDEAPDSSDPDEKLKCLMDLRYPGCTGPTDIRALADQLGASMAIVDYVRRLEPDYDTLPDGTEVARGAISYDARLWDCSSYINKGYFGYVLRMRADRYAATPSGDLTPYQLLQQFGGKTISPSEPFTKSVSIASLGGRHPDTVLISPNPGDDSLWSRSDPTQMKDVVYVAPIRASGGDGVLSGASFSSSDVEVREISAVGNTREYLIGTIGDNYWSTGQYDRTITFNLDNPASLEELKVTQVEFDDWLMINVNGTTVYIGPYGGDMLETSTASSAFEFNCAQTGVTYDSGFTCQRTTDVTYDAKGQANPPGPGCVYNGGYSDSMPYWTCPVQYKYCDFDYSTNLGNYLCRNTPCAEGMIQFMTNPPAGQGCGWPELRKQHRYNPNIDLRPYLKNGQNSIFMRTIVSGGGESWMTVRTRTCGAAMGLETGAPPPVPAGGGIGGVINGIYKKALQ